MRRRSAFTLVELLTVIAVIGVLTALLLPAVQAAREASRRTKCANNLRQIALGLQSYHDVHLTLPYGNAYTLQPYPKAAYSWSTMVLPFLERQAHYDLFDFDFDAGDATNARGVTSVVPTYLCPSDPLSASPVLDSRCICCNFGNASRSLALWYPGSVGPTRCNECPFCPIPAGTPDNWCCQGVNCGSNGDAAGMFHRGVNAVRFRDVLDGLSNTILNGETLPGENIHNAAFTRNMSLSYTNVPINTHATVDQMPKLGATDDSLHTTNPPERVMGFKSRHPGGAMFAFGDSAVRFIRDQIDYRLYCGLGSRAGAETQPDP